MGLFISLDSEGFTQEEYDDVILCLNTLFSIKTGEQALDRSLGVDYESIIDMPRPMAENALSLEIIEKVETYEPRVEIENISYSVSTDGTLIPSIKFIKNTDYFVEEEEDLEEEDENVEDIYEEYDDIDEEDLEELL